MIFLNRTHTPKRLSNEEILELWNKPMNRNTDILFISTEKGIEKLREVFDLNIKSKKEKK